MTCEEAMLLINGHLDQENTQAEEAQLLAHLEHCPACRELLQVLEQGDAAILSLEEEPPADLCSNVMAQIRQEGPKKRTSWKKWTGLAVAAALVLAVGLTQLTGQSEEPQAAYGARSMEGAAMPRAASYSAEMMPEWAQEEMGELAQQVADEQSAAILLLEQPLEDLEDCTCETTEDGCLLFCLEDKKQAETLRDQYDLTIYMPADGEEPLASYALLLP